MARQTGTRVRGLVIISTIAVALVLLLASAVQATGSGSTPDPAPAIVEYRVEPGDTLWAIAGAHGGENRDPRDVIDSIRALNGLEGSIIHAGQILQLPAG